MSETIDYFTRHSEVIPAEQRDYYAKIEKNQAAGWKALSSGIYTPFRGWSKEDSDKTFDIILELDDPSQQRVMERVVEPLRRLALAHNLTAIYPGYGDLPPHVVLQPGSFTNLTQEQIKAARGWLLSHKSRLDQLERILKGETTTLEKGLLTISKKGPLTFHHSSLVSAPNSYICASYFDTEQGVIYRARKFIEGKVQPHVLKILEANGQVYEEGKFVSPYSYYDICHSSVMRLTDKADPKDAIAFAQEAYSTVGIALRDNPVEVKIAGVFRDIATKYHEKYAPQLVIP